MHYDSDEGPPSRRRRRRKKAKHAAPAISPRAKKRKAAAMRKAPTRWEALASRILTDAGITHLPQHFVRGYIADIAIPSRHIILEVDGRQHLESAARKYDQRRTEHLKRAGWRVVRVMNSEVRDDAHSRQRLLALVHNEPAQ